MSRGGEFCLLCGVVRLIDKGALHTGVCALCTNLLEQCPVTCVAGEAIWIR
jgi:hypothetical protein